MQAIVNSSGVHRLHHRHIFTSTFIGMWSIASSVSASVCLFSNSLSASLSVRKAQRAGREPDLRGGAYLISRWWPTRLRLSCRASLIIVLVRPDFYSAAIGPQASHQLNQALGRPHIHNFFCVVQRRSSRPNRKSVYSPMPFNLSLRSLMSPLTRIKVKVKVRFKVKLKVKVKVMVGLRIPVRIRVWIRVWSDPDTNSDLVSDPELNAPQCTALSLQSQSILSVHHNMLAESVLFWDLTTTCSTGTYFRFVLDVVVII